MIVNDINISNHYDHGLFKVHKQASAGLSVQVSKEELQETLIVLLRNGFKFTGRQDNIMRTPIQGYLVIDMQKEIEEVMFEPA